MESLESLESLEHRYRQIIEALFELAESGPTKNSLWQAYQQLPQGQFQEVQKKLEKELDALRQWKKDWMLVVVDWSEHH